MLRGELCSCLAHLERSHAAINESNNLQHPDTHAPSRCLLRQPLRAEGATGCLLSSWDLLKPGAEPRREAGHATSPSHILCGQCRDEDPWFWKGPALPACTALALSGLPLQQLAGKGVLLHSGSNFKLPEEGSLLIPPPRAWPVPAPGSGVEAPAARRLGQGWSPPEMTCGPWLSSPSWGPAAHRDGAGGVGGLGSLAHLLSVQYLVSAEAECSSHGNAAGRPSSAGVPFIMS